MASAGEDSDDGELKVGLHRSGGSTSSRKILESSSDEEAASKDISGTKTPSTKDNGDSDGRRRSHRKKQRFQMPSREEQWNAIPSSTVDKLSRIKPRKLVFNLTKVNHRYNYDYDEVSGEESMEEFIKNTDSSDSASDTESSGKEAHSSKSHRVKGYRPRINTLSDTSSDSEQETPDASETTSKTSSDTISKTPTLQDKTIKGKRKILTGEANSHETENEKAKETHEIINGRKSSAITADQQKPSPSSEKLCEQGDSARKRKAKAVISSDSDTSNGSQFDSQEIVNTPKSKKSKTKAVASSDSDRSNDSQFDSQEVVQNPKRKKSKSILESDSEDENLSEKHQHATAAGQGEHAEKTTSDKSAGVRTVGTSTRSTSNKKSSSRHDSDTGYMDDETSSDNASTDRDSGDGSSEDDSGSGDDVTDDSDDAEDIDSDDDDGDRIAKLAAQKTSKKEAMFGSLLAARSKRQKSDSGGNV